MNLSAKLFEQMAGLRILVLRDIDIPAFVIELTCCCAFEIFENLFDYSEAVRHNSARITAVNSLLQYSSFYLKVKHPSQSRSYAEMLLTDAAGVKAKN